MVCWDNNHIYNMQTNTFLKEYFIHINRNIFSVQFLKATLSGILPITAPNTKWSFINSGHLSLHLLIIAILASESYYVVCRTVMAQRQVTLSIITLSILREIFPLFRSDKNFRLTFGEDSSVALLLEELLVEVEKEQSAYDHPILGDNNSFAQWKRTTMVTLRTMLSSTGNQELFVSTCLDVLVGNNMFFDVGTKSWQESTVYIQGPNPDLTPLLFRRIFRLPDGVFASSGDDFPHRRSFFLYYVLALYTSVKVNGKTYVLSSPSIDDKLTVLPDSPLQSFMVDLFTTLKLESGITKEKVLKVEKPTKPVHSAKTAEKATSSKRSYGTLASNVHHYKYSAIIGNTQYFSDDISDLRSLVAVKTGKKVTNSNTPNSSNTNGFQKSQPLSG